MPGEAYVCSVVLDSATPWTVAHWVPLSLGFSRQECSAGCHFLFQKIELHVSCISCIGRWVLYHCATGRPLEEEYQMSAEPCDHKPSLLWPKKILFLCVCWLCWVFVAAHGLSPAAEWGLCCCTWAFSSCRAGSLLLRMGFLQLQSWVFAVAHGLSPAAERGHSPAATHRLGSWDAWAQYLWPTGLATVWHVKPSQTRDQTCVPCIGRWILYTGSPGKSKEDSV